MNKENTVEAYLLLQHILLVPILVITAGLDLFLQFLDPLRLLLQLAVVGLLLLDETENRRGRDCQWRGRSHYVSLGALRMFVRIPGKVSSKLKGDTWGIDGWG